MSAEDVKKEGWTVLPTWFPIVTVCLSAFFGAGGAWATNQSENGQQDYRLGQIEKRLDTIETMSRDISSIRQDVAVLAERMKKGER